MNTPPFWPKDPENITDLNQIIFNKFSSGIDALRNLYLDSQVLNFEVIDQHLQQLVT